MKFSVVASSVLVLAFLHITSPASAANVQILDDYGNAFASLNTLYTNNGDTVSALNHDFGGTNLTGDKIVLTNIPTDYSSGEVSNLVSYVNGGGRLVLGSEFHPFSDPSITATNKVLTALGSSIVNNFDEFDDGFHTTTNILTSPFTAGVSSIDYAATSSLSGGTPLVNGVSGQTFVAFQKIGLGYVFVVADSNLAGEVNDPTFGNGQLFLNFENASVSMSTVPLPPSLPMFGAAILGLGAVGYGMKRKKATTAA